MKVRRRKPEVLTPDFGLLTSDSQLPMKKLLISLVLFAQVCCTEKRLPDFSDFEHYIDVFNEHDNELYVQYIPNEQAADFLRDNIPIFQCPDPDIERTYYFRWWTYRKHIKQTDTGFVITEFLPEVSWAGPHNTISCGLSPHIMEGRWLHNPEYLDDYIDYWCYGGKEGGLADNLFSYSNWMGDALWQRYLVNGRKDMLVTQLPAMIAAFEKWKKEHGTNDHLYWSYDVRDGMEESVSGSRTRKNRRATISAYAYGDAKAIANTARLAQNSPLLAAYEKEAASIKEAINEKLWDKKAQFYKVLFENDSLSGCRELHGFTPWYFSIPPPAHAIAWEQLMDKNGFFSPYGPTTAEQRHPGFSVEKAYTSPKACRWDGPVWPFATSVTLTALANYLNESPQPVLSKKDYFRQLQIYAKSQQLVQEEGGVVPWIDESLDPRNGAWITRERFNNMNTEGWQAKERGKDYNHSTFCDLVITGLIGVRPGENEVTVNPLIPADTWDWFYLNEVLYKGKNLAVIWDKTGRKYGLGKGFKVFYAGKEVFSSNTIEKAIVKL